MARARCPSLRRCPAGHRVEPEAAGGAAVEVVRIQADGVVFGKAKKGFTLTRAGTGFTGLFIDAASGVRVAGNLATGNGFGFVVAGSEHNLTGNRGPTDQSAESRVVLP